MTNIQFAPPQKDIVSVSEHGDLLFNGLIFKSSAKQLTVYIPLFDNEENLTRSQSNNGDDLSYYLDSVKKVVHLEIQFENYELNPNQDFGNTLSKWLAYIRLKYSSLNYFKLNIDLPAKKISISFIGTCNKQDIYEDEEKNELFPCKSIPFDRKTSTSRASHTQH